MRTWKILQWEDRPSHVRNIEFPCRNCGMESILSINAAARIVAILSHGGVIFDPGYPANALPDEIQCRHCHVILNNVGEDRIEELDGLRQAV